MATKVDTKTETYKDQAAFNKDTEKRLKDGWTYDPDMIREGKSDVQTETYRSTKAYRKDSEKRAKDGWEVTNTVTNQPRFTIRRFLLTGGIGYFFFKPKPEIIVTYTKVEKIVTWTRSK